MIDPVAHAKSYPFAIPDFSFVLDAGEVRRVGGTAIDRRDRVPVLAAGSNQSPEQLARKYRPFGRTVIPADRAKLHGFDVVYAAHLSSYGSVPATFQVSPGTAVTVFVLWLDQAQLSRMHETEGNYTYDRIERIRVTTDEGGTLTEAYAYSSKIGCLEVEGGCIALSEIGAEGRRFPALGQAEIQARLRDRLSPGVHVDDFVRAHIDDEVTRRERSRCLATGAIRLAFDREVVLRL